MPKWLSLHLSTPVRRVIRGTTGTYHVSPKSEVAVEIKAITLISVKRVCLPTTSVPSRNRHQPLKPWLSDRAPEGSSQVSNRREFACGADNQKAGVASH